MPLSLGVETLEDYCETFMTVVIPRNSRIPIKRNTTIVTRYDNQVTIKFPIYEGENTNTKNNNFLGQFKLEGIPPAPKGTAKFDVWFSIDANGILSVSAEDKSTGQRKGITIMSYKDVRNFEGIEAVN
ncbi:hypothetical protein TB1_001327 [Malus domestica]